MSYQNAQEFAQAVFPNHKYLGVAHGTENVYDEDMNLESYFFYSVLYLTQNDYGIKVKINEEFQILDVSTGYIKNEYPMLSAGSGKGFNFID